MGVGGEGKEEEVEFLRYMMGRSCRENAGNVELELQRLWIARCQAVCGMTWCVCLCGYVQMYVCVHALVCVYVSAHAPV